MQKFSLDQYMEADCFQVERGPGLMVGIALYDVTQGEMCPGCPKYENGKCESYQTLLSFLPKPEAKESGETVRQEAARLGIGIKEVRRRRKRQ